MAEQIPFTEVGSEGSGVPENAKEYTEVMEAPYEPEENVHVYITFLPEITPEDGISVIEQEILAGNSLQIERVDTAGNAVVAIMTYEEQQKAGELPQVASIKIMEAAEQHQDTSIGQEKESAREEEVSESEEKVPEPETEYSGTIQGAKSPEETATEASTAEQYENHSREKQSGFGMLVILIAALLFLLAGFRKIRKR